MITSPERYFFNDRFLEECACGKGSLDIELYTKLATAEDPQMPMIIEHLTTDEEYIQSVEYVRKRLSC